MAGICSHILRRISRQLPSRVSKPAPFTTTSVRTLSTSRTMMSDDDDDEVLFETRANSGVITLNRPRALNALNLNMIRTMHPVVEAWDQDPDINVIVMKGAGEKAFCAGGDVVAVTSQGEATELSQQFFKEEYQLNYLLANLRTPYVAVIHGITMGGGVGLSVHGRYRVATEKTLFAMPETAIGLFPDVGGGYFLPRLSNHLGTFLSLTGHRLKGWDNYCAGVATHFVSTQELPYLHDELCNLNAPTPTDVEHLLSSYHGKCTAEHSTSDFSLHNHLAQIGEIFSSDSVEGIISKLETEGSEWSLKQLKTLKKMSPSSMKITLRQLQQGARMDLKQVLEMEYRMSQACMDNNDFYEGIRAMLVDRDNTPVWKPSTLEEVAEQIVDSYFEKLPQDRELLLP